MKILSRVFRGKFLAALKRLHSRNKLCCSGPAAALADPQQFAKLMRRLHRHDWVVYAKPAFGGPMQVLRYLGPVLKGRSFRADDQLQTEAVAIVNEALVKKYFDTEDPVGRRIRSFGAPPERNPWRRIVGVVANEKRGNPFQEMSWLDTPTIFLPISQVPPSRVTLLIRSDVDPMSLTNIIQRQVSTLDPRQLFEISVHG